MVAVAALWALAVIAQAADAVPRPSEEDLVACVEFARAAAGGPPYTERAPLSSFPRRFSGVGPWTGPITLDAPPLPESAAAIDSPTTSGIFGAGGGSQEDTSEAGAGDPRFQEAFDACMRSRGY